MAVGILIIVIAVSTVRGALAQNPADVAWNDGDLATAERLYAERLATDSSDVRALHRLALINAWGDRYDASLALFDRLLSVSPSNLEARRDRARVLSWAGRFPESVAAYDTLADMSDNDRPARLGMAEVLSWAGNLDSSAAVYRRLLAVDSNDVDARRGLARVTSWGGELVRAETEWRKAVAADSDDVASLVGLAQTLRWQGRVAAAVPFVERGRRLAPGDRNVNAEWRYVEAAMAPRVAPAVTYETDSDGNRISTLSVRGAWRPQRRVELGVETYIRRGTWERGGVGAQHSRGALARVRLDLDPGWTVGIGAGASRAGIDTARTKAQWLASVTTPGRYHVGAGLSYRRAALDATALLIERGVTMGELALSLRAEPASGWALAGAISRATFNGTESNSRVAGYAIGTRRLTRQWTVGARLRALGYRRDLNDGYFDPNRYVIGEALLRWRRQFGSWSLRGEVAGGAQQVRRGGSVQATGQASAGATFAIAPGREVGLSAAFSRSGLQTFATPASGYRYLSVGLSSSWWF